MSRLESIHGGGIGGIRIDLFGLILRWNLFGHLRENTFILRVGSHGLKGVLNVYILIFEGNVLLLEKLVTVALLDLIARILLAGDVEGKLLVVYEIL